MKKNSFNVTNWAERYHQNDTPWDVGYVSTPIKAYADQLSNKQIKILIPGAGNAYEAEYLWNSGFRNTFVADIARTPLKNLKSRILDFPDKQLLHIDFFRLDGTYDLIIEQTFFCAIAPEMRIDYVKKSYELLSPGGKLVGLFFDFPLTNQGPPFGGNIDSYYELFSNNFKIITLEKAYNSIGPRENNELFFIFKKL